jgi:hypothetical protein
MLDNDPHLTDEEILLLSDGELMPERAAQARQHIAACWECRTRLGEFEHTIANFIGAHHASLDPQLPPDAGPRALFKARVSQPLPIASRESWLGFLQFALAKHPWAYVCAALLLGTISVWFGRYHARRESPAVFAQLRPELIPNRALTPGVARLVAREDVCAMEGEENDPAGLIPASLQQEALREYGVTGSQAKDFQLDYLIPPALGGTDDIRNLWPEPNSEAVWNARAKDALENRLRELVCGGRVDLPTAQHEIATDWISAYKKYFHTHTPV